MINFYQKKLKQIKTKNFREPSFWCYWKNILNSIKSYYFCARGVIEGFLIVPKVEQRNPRGWRGLHLITSKERDVPNFIQRYIVEKMRD